MNQTIEKFDRTASLGLLEPTHDWAFGLEVEVVDFLSGYTIPGILEGFTPGEVTVSLPETISEQRTVTVRLNSFLFGGETLYCRPKESRYEAHITIDDAGETGLRRVPRFPVRLPAQVLPSRGAAIEITIVDISGDGLGIESPAPVEVGQPIAIASGSVFVFAVVAHCRPAAGGLFRAGVRIQHLFEKPSEVVVEAGRPGLLGRVFGKRVETKRTF